jgi:hypothetical protein
MVTGRLYPNAIHQADRICTRLYPQGLQGGVRMPSPSSGYPEALQGAVRIRRRRSSPDGERDGDEALGTETAAGAGAETGAGPEKRRRSRHAPRGDPPHDIQRAGNRIPHPIHGATGDDRDESDEPHDDRLDGHGDDGYGYDRKRKHTEDDDQADGKRHRLRRHDDETLSSWERPYLLHQSSRRKRHRRSDEDGSQADVAGCGDEPADIVPTPKARRGGGSEADSAHEAGVLHEINRLHFCRPACDEAWTRRLSTRSSCSSGACHRCHKLTRTECKGCRRLLCVACARSRTECMERH